MPDYNASLKKHTTSLEQQWDNDIIPVLEDYIRIPNKSVVFDTNWKHNGYMDQAMQLLKQWCEKQPIKGMQIELLEHEGRTPLLLIDIAGQSDDTILLYGHMDKQPEMVGWDDDLDPWKPVLKDGKLYGRGGADDGYALFSSLSAIQSLQDNNIAHARCLIMIEASEESGSIDLPFYIETLKQQIGTPSLIICLDAEAGNYDTLWCNTSIRGLASGDLRIDILKEGIHSGNGSGMVPSTFSILRELLDRVEDAKTSRIALEALYVDIPEHRIKQAEQTAKLLGDAFYQEVPFLNGAAPITTDVKELILNRFWRPYLSIVGLDGLPELSNAGNVTIPSLEVKLSFRLPPTCDANKAGALIKKTLEDNPPFSAKITFAAEDNASGWNAPQMSEWLVDALTAASHTFFEQPLGYTGTGGTIPFMGMLGELFPDAQFFITGVLGPKANAHGPNEFLHIPYVKKLTQCVASVIAAHHERT